MSGSAPLPTAEQQQRAKWDLLLLDIETRTEQVRQLKRYEPWKLVISAITAAVVLIGGVGAGTVWLLHIAGVSP